MNAKYQLMMTFINKEEATAMSTYATLKAADHAMSHVAHHPTPLRQRPESGWRVSKLDRHALLEEYRYDGSFYQYLYWIRNLATGQPVLSC